MITTPFLCLFLLIAGFEVLLRYSPTVFGNNIATKLYNKYTTSPGGIYFYEPLTETHRMWPNFHTRAYHNGYFWDHKTDENGFRNPPDRQKKEILLLGDSFIYGHGVDDVSTVSHFLHSKFKRNVYNMAVQGNSIYEEYILARLHLDAFDPKTVIVFFYGNDFSDIESRLAKRKHFSSPPELFAYNYKKIAGSIASLGSKLPASPLSESRPAIIRFLSIVLADSLASRFVVFANARPERKPSIRRFLKRLDNLDGIDSDPDVMLADFQRLALDYERLLPIALYYENIFADLKRRCDVLGVNLVVVNLDPRPPWRLWVKKRTLAIKLSLGLVFKSGTGATDSIQNLLRAQARQLAAKNNIQASLRHICRKLQINLWDTRDVFWQCHNCQLPDDGHLNEHGHRLLAEFIDRKISEDKLDNR
jgi:GDSL-like Lipase/Acylhydrolase